MQPVKVINRNAALGSSMGTCGGHESSQIEMCVSELRELWNGRCTFTPPGEMRLPNKRIGEHRLLDVARHAYFRHVEHSGVLPAAAKLHLRESFANGKVYCLAWRRQGLSKYGRGISINECRRVRPLCGVLFDTVGGMFASAGPSPLV